VHIAGYCSVSGASDCVTIEDFAGIANRVTIYTGSDDFRGNHLNGPMVPAEFVETISGPVTLEEACIVGAHSVILPRVTIGTGAAVGALCLIVSNVEPGAIVVSPAARWTILGALDRLLSKSNAIGSSTGYSVELKE
jgi:acetyltransferase-like isoleucine patch superfamily enzyme